MSLTKEESALRAWVSRLGRVFGLSADDYYAILELQDGQCPICGKPAPETGERRFPVDHDHKTGEVRGVPCLYSNRYQIGRLTRADIPMLRRLIDYLDDPPAIRYFGSPRIVPGHGKRKRRARKKPVA